MPDLPSAKSLGRGESQAEGDRRLWESIIERERKKLELIRLCQRILEPDRKTKGSGLEGHFGHVYLKTRPRSSAYKIGSSGRQFRQRSKELKGMQNAALYRTVVYKALEKAAHNYFDHVRLKTKDRQPGQRRYAAGEKFWITESDVANFKETLKLLEKWILQIEGAKLELGIARLEDACRRYDTAVREPIRGVFE